MNIQNSENPSLATMLAGALLGLSLLFMSKGYFGIDHDSALYLGEILRIRFPDILDQDLFFAHGSQGRYTLFPYMIAAILPLVDVPALFMWATIIGMLFFTAASWQAIRNLLPTGQRYLPWLAIICLPTVYGAYKIFGYGEAFFTPRLYAEPLCLLAVGLLVQKRVRAAMSCIAAACLLHPLQAIGALLVVWPWLVMQDRRWLRALWLIPAVGLLAVIGVQPFNRLLQEIDPATLPEVRTYSAHLFIGEWRQEAFQKLGFDALILVLAVKTITSPMREWCKAAIAGLALGLATSLVLVDALHLALPAGLQLWRVHWLVHWLAMATIGILLQRDLQARNFPRVALLGLAFTLAYGLPGWTWMLFGLLYAIWPQIEGRIQPRAGTLLAVVFATGIAAIFAIYIANEYLSFQQARHQLVIKAFDRSFFTFPALSLGLALLGVHLWRRFSTVGKCALFVAALCPLATYAASRWDSRPALYKSLERSAYQPRLFGVELPRHAQVYWERASVVGSWLVLNRADYYSPQQLSGLVFSPGAAQEARARINRFKPLREDVKHCTDPALSDAARRGCRISDAGMRASCAPTQASRPPDYVILPYRQPQRALGSWSFTDPSAQDPVSTYWLYDCREVMNELQSLAGNDATTR